MISGIPVEIQNRSLTVHKYINNIEEKPLTIRAITMTRVDSLTKFNRAWYVGEKGMENGFHIRDRF